MKTLERAFHDLKGNLDSGNSLVDRRLTAIQDYICHYVNTRDYEGLTHVRDELLELTRDSESRDNYSFRLGKIAAIAELVWGITATERLLSHSRQLTAREREVLLAIQRHKEITNSQLCKMFSMEPNHTSNVLAQLRKTDLVFVRPMGKERWYSLTPLGEKTADHLQPPETVKIEEETEHFMVQSSDLQSYSYRKHMISFAEERNYYFIDQDYDMHVSSLDGTTRGIEVKSHGRGRIFARSKSLVQTDRYPVTRECDFQDWRGKRDYFELCEE